LKDNWANFFVFCPSSHIKFQRWELLYLSLFVLFGLDFFFSFICIFSFCVLHKLLLKLALLVSNSSICSSSDQGFRQRKVKLTCGVAIHVLAL
jgi:hypothetical protein